MIEYLLDTNTCIALINGTNQNVAAKRESIQDGQVAVPSVVAFELAYGVAKSTRRSQNQAALSTFLSALDVMAFDHHDADSAGWIKSQLEAAGTPIGAYDLLIAGQALARDLTIVTNNMREFSRVPGLKVEDWL